MVQNYVKWKNMPGPIGKKYRTMHITWALVITLLKKVLTIPEIELGIELQLRIQPLEAAYDNFCEILETALFSSCSPLLALDETYEFTAQTIRTEFVATFTVCQALAYKLLTERIITCNGFAQNHRLFTLGQSPQISNRGESHA